MSKNMKKILISMLIISMLFSVKLMSKENKYSQFTKETQEWMIWYDSLSDDDKRCISYVPYELIIAKENGFEYKLVDEQLDTMK